MAATDGTHVWIGAETGILKGVNLAKKTGVNYSDLTELSKDQEITNLCWGKNEDTFLAGLRNGMVKTFDSNAGVYIKEKDCSGGEGVFSGLATTDDDALITCVSSGLLKVWKDEPDECTELDVGANIWKMRQNINETHQVATGGKENDLKLWDLNNPTEPIFKAKNVRNTFLELRVPVWVMDMQFIADSSKIITCTGHHQVRLYDPSTPQRRPVLDVEFGEYPIMSLSVLADGNSVIVGNSHGYMGRIDLRKGLVRRVYKGFAGSIRSIQCHPTLPVVATCGLDRYLRIHDAITGTLQTKVYLKSRLNCLLFSSKDYTQEMEASEVFTRSQAKRQAQELDNKEHEEIWDKMEVIDESKSTGKHKSSVQSKTEKKPAKRRKTAGK